MTATKAEQLKIDKTRIEELYAMLENPSSTSSQRQAAGQELQKLQYKISEVKSKGCHRLYGI